MHAALRGFSILSALFLLVVLSALGAVLVTVSTTQHTSSALDVEGVRAYQAARAGLEWGLYVVTKQQVTVGNGEGGTTAFAATSCPFEKESFVPGASGLAQFTVSVSCTPFAQANVRIFLIRATACNQAFLNACPGKGQSTYYVERQLQATIEG